MRVLVDTSYLYALMSSEDLFTAPERDFVERRNAEIFVSAASIWEMRIKYGSRHRSGDRRSPYDPQRVLRVLEEVDVELLPLTEVHAAQPLDVPVPTRIRSTKCCSPKLKRKACDSSPRTGC